MIELTAYPLNLARCFFLGNSHPSDSYVSEVDIVQSLGVSQPFERGEERSKDRNKCSSLCLSSQPRQKQARRYADYDRRAAPALPYRTGSLRNSSNLGFRGV